MKIALTSVFVNNPLSAYTFYTEVLGFVKKLYMPEANIAIVASPEEPESVGLLLEPNDNPIAKTYQEALFNTGMAVIIFGTSDINKEHERLKSLGVVFKQDPKKTEWGFEAIFNDTCGNYIQLAQMA